MIVLKETSNELIKFQEDVASYFCSEHFPLSGEAYWTMVESLATAKLAELRGLVTS